MSELNDKGKLQNVTLKDRREIKICGIMSVDSFDECRICATCHDGTAVVVDGAGLSIKEVNLESSYVEAVGDIQGFFYDEKTQVSKSGFLRNLFVKK